VEEEKSRGSLAKHRFTLKIPDKMVRMYVSPACRLCPVKETMIAVYVLILWLWLTGASAVKSSLCSTAENCHLNLACFLTCAFILPSYWIMPGLLQVKITGISWSWYSTWLVRHLMTTSVWRQILSVTSCEVWSIHYVFCIIGVWLLMWHSSFFLL